MGNDLKKITLENSKQEYLQSRGETIQQVKTYELKLSGIKEITEKNIPEVKSLLKEASKIVKAHGESRLRYTNAINAYVKERIEEEKRDLEFLNQYITEVRVKLDNYVQEQERIAQAEKERIRLEANKNAEIETIKIKLKLNYDISINNAIHDQRTLIADTFNKLTLEQFDQRIANLPSYKPKYKSEDFVKKISDIKVEYVNPDELEGLVRTFIEENTFTKWVEKILVGVDAIKSEYYSQAENRKEFLKQQMEVIKKQQEENIIKEYEAKKQAEIKISEAKINENIKVQVQTKNIPTQSVRRLRKVKASANADWNRIISLYLEDNSIEDLYDTKIGSIVNFLLKKNEPKIEGVTYFNEVKATI